MTAGGQATGIALNTIGRGVKALAHSLPAARRAERQRQPGGGRKPLTAHDPQRLRALAVLVAPYTRGDPGKPLALDLQERARAGEGAAAAQSWGGTSQGGGTPAGAGVQLTIQSQKLGGERPSGSRGAI